MAEDEIEEARYQERKEEKKQRSSQIDRLIEIGSGNQGSGKKQNLIDQKLSYLKHLYRSLSSAEDKKHFMNTYLKPGVEYLEEKNGLL